MTNAQSPPSRQVADPWAEGAELVTDHSPRPESHARSCRCDDCLSDFRADHESQQW